MKDKRILSAGGGVLAASLALACPAAGQASHARIQSETVEGRKRVSVQGTGETRYTDDDREVAYVEPGGQLRIEETRPGQPTRRVEYAPGPGGGVERRFYRDGRETAPDAADQAWLHEALLYPIRESARYVEPRVQRLFRAGGAAAVLEEIGRLGNDNARRLYYTALLRHPGLGDDSAARVLRDAGSSMSGGTDQRMVLELLLQHPSPTLDQAVAMLEGAARLQGSSDRAMLLAQAAGRAPLANARVREAFFRATRGVQHPGDRTRVLAALPAAALADPAVRAAFAGALDTLPPDERARLSPRLARP